MIIKKNLLFTINYFCLKNLQISFEFKNVLKALLNKNFINKFLGKLFNIFFIKTKKEIK